MRLIYRLIKIAIGLSIYIADNIKRYGRRILRCKSDATGVVIYYHAVTKAQRKKFAQQMDTLLRIGRPISAEDMDQLQSCEHYVSVTFDDGFVCVIENALPELAQRNIPATIFIPTGCIGQQPEWLVRYTGQGQQDTVMTIGQIKELKDNNLVSFGSHGVTHSNLLLLEREKAKNEIFQSKKDLECIIEKNVNLFSFPYGAFNDACLEWAQEAGYKGIFTISPAFVHQNRNKITTGRVSVEPTDWPLEYRLKLAGAYRWLPLAFALKANIRSIINYRRANSMDSSRE
jgi:peptidoglycan/xylan/chitin deacetylase (PgdA/CDA1 family)